MRSRPPPFSRPRATMRQGRSAERAARRASRAKRAHLLDAAAPPRRGCRLPTATSDTFHSGGSGTRRTRRGQRSTYIAMLGGGSFIKHGRQTDKGPPRPPGSHDDKFPAWTGRGRSTDFELLRSGTRDRNSMWDLHVILGPEPQAHGPRQHCHPPAADAYSPRAQPRRAAPRVPTQESGPEVFYLMAQRRPCGRTPPSGSRRKEKLLGGCRGHWGWSRPTSRPRLEGGRPKAGEAGRRPQR